MSTRHLVIPDVQAKPGHTFEHMKWAGKYAVDKQPDVIICLGDLFDMPSLSSYDVGKKSFEGRCYKDDIKAGKEALRAFDSQIEAYNKQQKKNKKKLYTPMKVFLIGNHEQRIQRAVESDRKLEGMLTYDDFELEKSGWIVSDFLEPFVIDGVCYSHYFTSGVMGRPVANAKLMLQKKHMSCVMGHVQDRDIAFSKRADGKTMTGIFAGIFYRHNESYLTPQTNGSWAGVWMLHDVRDGEFDEMPVSIRYLEKRYG